MSYTLTLNKDYTPTVRRSVLIFLFNLSYFFLFPHLSAQNSITECMTPGAGGSSSQDAPFANGRDCFHFIGDLPTDGCDNFMNYAPNADNPSYTTVKNVQLVLHVFQKDDGSRNFQNTSEDIDLLNQTISEVNSIFGNSDAINNQDPNCPTEHIPDSRIQFNLSQILFHKDSDAWCSGHVSNTNPHGCDIYDLHITNNDDLSPEVKENSIHILLLGCRKENANGTGGEVFHIGGYASGIPSNGDKFIMVKGWYYHAVEKNNPEPYLMRSSIATNLAHEIGHTLGLYHAFSGDYCCDTYTGGSTNNVMTYPEGRAFTRCQLARMHYILEGKTNSDIYKTDITNYCNITYPSIVIPDGADVVWEIDKKVNSDILIETGGQLTIKCRLGMPEKGSIIVQRGARLFVDGGTITKNCEKRWNGILVAGNTNYLQTPEMRQADFPLEPDGPGFVIIQDGLIEYARTAISTQGSNISWPESKTYNGGLVYAEGATFKNNKRAAEFLKYDPVNFSAFNACQFLNEDGTADLGVTNWACNGIIFQHCTFDRINQVGILTYDAGIGVINSGFTGINHAIEAFATMPLISNIEIGTRADGTGNEFKDNNVGVYGHAINRLHIYNNRFDDNEYGVALEGESQFNIALNSFIESSVGIDLVQTSGQYSKIECNSHTNDFIGIDASGSNVSFDFTGQDFRTTYDVVLTEEGNTAGMLSNQGTELSTPLNYFSENSLQHINTYGNTRRFSYFYWADKPVGRRKPKCSLNDSTSCIATNNFTTNPGTKGVHSCEQISGENPDDSICWTSHCLDHLKDQLHNIDLHNGNLSDSVEHSRLEKLISYVLWKQVNHHIDNNNRVAAIALLEAENTPIANRHLFGLHLQSEEWSNAQAQLAQLPTENITDQYFVETQIINLKRLQQEAYTLSEVEHQRLNTIADSRTSSAAVARGLLSYLKSNTYQPEITFPLSTERSQSISSISIEESPVNIFPNPARESINFSFNPCASNCTFQIQLFNSVGSIVRQWTSTDQKSQLSTNEIDAGIYYIKVTNAQGLAYTEKLIIIK